MLTNGTLFIPQVNSGDSGTYECIASNEQTALTLPTVVIVNETIPRFSQNPLSYLTFPTLPDAYLKFELVISIKPEKPDGLILFNGDSQFNVDFISLALRECFVEFRFELGSGEVTIIRSESPLELNKWHTVYVGRNKAMGSLRVDGQNLVTRSGHGKAVGLDLSLPLYMGGVPNFENITSIVELDQGFVGCIANFKVGSKRYDLISDSEDSFEVSRCDTCMYHQCQNGGICKENVFTPEDYECVCPVGFNGKYCEISGDTCYPGVCNLGFCVQLSPIGFHCQCPFGTAGRFCEQNISITEPLLSNGAYLAYKPPKNSIEKLDIRMKIKPKSLEASQLILYTAQHLHGKGDFASLVIINKTVHFIFDTGSGSVDIESNQELVEEEWIDIVVKRYHRHANLTVGNEETISGTAPGKTYGLTLVTPLYLGGYNRSKLVLSPSLKSVANFEGCIGHVSVDWESFLG